MSHSAEAQFTADVVNASRAAESATGATIQRIDVAGVRIDLRYAGSSLHDVMAPALAHLEVAEDAPAEPALTGRPAVVVRLWDTESTGVSAPTAPVERNRFTDRGDVIGMDDPAYRVAYHWSEYSVSVLDVGASEGAFWVAKSAHLPYWTRSSPLRTIFGWVLENHGRQLLHAAAVATRDGAVLIAGAGGVGKSTTALTCLESGMGFLGDDYVVVSADPPTVHTLYATAKIADTAHPAAKLFPTMLASPDDEKVVLQLYPAATDLLIHSAPLRAIVTPEVVDNESTVVTTVDRDRLEHACTFTTLAQLPHAGARARTHIGRLLDEVPGGLLALGRDPAGVVEAIQELAANPSISTSATVSGDLPTLTVIIPVLNGAHFLASAIESILVQKYPRLEIVIVDDGSEDDLPAAIAALPVDVRVHHQATAGPAAARNRGIRMATSELVAFLDVDDRWPPGALSTLVKEWMKGKASVVIGRGQVVELHPESGEERPVWTPENSFPNSIASAVFERTVFERIGDFDPEMLYGEDTDWFTRLAESDEVLSRIPDVTLVVRRHGKNMTEGLDLVQLHVVRAIKKALDRERQRDSST